MAATATLGGPERYARRAYQREVERLLEDIRDRVRRLQLLEVAGLWGAARADEERELERTRRRLAGVVRTHAGAGDAAR
jgi:hypothetical protein